MTAGGRRDPSSLVWIVSRRLVVAFLIGMLLQASVVAVRDYLNENDFLSSYIRREGLEIARMVTEAPTMPGAAPVNLPWQFTGAHADAYAFRVVDAHGKVLHSHNEARLLQVLPPGLRSSPQLEFWWQKTDPDRRMHVMGGIKTTAPSGDVWVEFMTAGDPARTYLFNLVADIADDIWGPALPTALLALWVAMTSVRRSLRPLAQAASRADEISILEPGERLDASRLPAEAADFASAINRLLDRVANLVSAQRQFIGRAAHELRTPLSILMLEVANLKQPESSRIEGDLRVMRDIVDRLLMLSRLQTIERPRADQQVDIATMARDLTARMTAWVEAQHHSIAFASNRRGAVLGDEQALRDGLRNLIENAVMHTPPGSHIDVAVDSDGAISVDDNGPGLGELSAEAVQQPFVKGSPNTPGAGLGLAIVREAMNLHGGHLEISPSPRGGARFVMRLPTADGSAIESAPDV